MQLELWDIIHTPNARGLAYCKLHIFGMRIPLIFQVNLIGQMSFSPGGKEWRFSCAPLSSIVVIYSCPIFSPQIVPSLHSKMLQINPLLTSKPVCKKFYNQHQMKCTLDAFDIIEDLSSNMQHGMALDANIYVKILSSMYSINIFFSLDTSTCE